MNVNLKSPAVQRGVLGALASVGALGLFFFSNVLPIGWPRQSVEIARIKTEYEKKSTELARARATVADLPRFEAEYARVHSQWAHAAQLVPTEHKVPTLLRQITLAAQQNGIGLTMLRPSEPKNEQHYTEMPMEFAIVGPYHQIGSFLANLANLPRIVTVSELKLKSNEVKNDNGPSGTTTAEFTASSYYLNTTANTVASPPEAPAANRNKEEEQNVHKDS